MRSVLQPYPDYKPSGVEWLGDVPEHWDVRRLGISVHGCINGIWGNDPNGREDLPCVRVADFDRLRLRVRLANPTLRAIAPSERNRRLLKKSDLLLEKSGGGDLQPVGVVMLYDHDVEAVCSNFVARMPVSARCDSSYLTYLHAHLYAIRLNLRSIKQTTGIQNLDSSSYLGEPVAFPPLPEQSAIVRYLDHADWRIRRYIRAKQKLITLLEEQKQALIHQAVTGQIDVHTGRPYPAYKDSGVEWMKPVPEHWDVLQLGRFGQFFKGTGGTKDDEVEHGVPCVRYGDLYTTHKFFIIKSRAYVTEERAADYTPIRYGDVLFAGSGETIDEIGKSAVNLLSGSACCGGDVIVFRTGNECSAKFLGYATDCWTAATQKSTMGRGITVMHVYGTSLKYLSVALPPVQEQTAIVRILENARANMDAAVARARRQIDLFREYRTRLIADVVTGKLDVREAAASLLEEADERDPLDEVVPLADDVVDNLYHRVGRGAGNGK